MLDTPSAPPESRATTPFWKLWCDLAQSGHSTPFLLIDCAGVEGGRQRLPAQVFARLESLFAGDLADELADAGPYLGQLASLSDAVGAIVLDLLVRRVAVLVSMPEASQQQESPDPFDVTFDQLHRHLRKFNVIYGSDSSALYFRYYDPRVLDDVLCVMQAPQLIEFFGPIHTLGLVNQFNQLVQCGCRNGQLTILP